MEEHEHIHNRIPESLDDEYDRKPGREGESPEYAKTYGVEEDTNEPEGIIKRQWEREEDQHYARQRISMRADAGDRIHWLPSFGGPIIIPQENTFAGQLQLITDSTADIHFSPEKYPHFDRVLAAAADRPDIFDPEHADYPKYENLRNNLAVLRNYIAAVIKFGGDGTFDAGDENDLPSFREIAKDIGQAINYAGRPLPRLFVPTLDERLLNMEGDGAAYAYQYLTARQRESGPVFGDIIRDIRVRTGLDVREWGLPPIDKTPFSEAALNAPAAPDVLCMDHAQMDEYCRTHPCPENTCGKDWRAFVQAQREAAPEGIHVGAA